MSRFTNLEFLYTNQKVVATSGKPVKLSGYTVATTIAFNEVGATGDTITDSASGFLKAGFKVGDKITVSGSSSNDGTYSIKTLTAGTLTVGDSDDLVNEVAGAEVTLSESVGVPVESGVKVVVKALSSNTGTITLGTSSAKALKTSTFGYPMLPLESITLMVNNLNKIWMDASVSGEGVAIIFETN